MFLKAVDGKVPLIVELKYKEGSKICEKAQEILNSYTGIYCIESFHPQVLVWYRKNYPHICRGQLSMNFERDDNTKGAQYFALRHLLTNFLTKPDFIAYMIAVQCMQYPKTSAGTCLAVRPLHGQ